MVDVLGLIGQMLDRIRPGFTPKPVAKPAGGMAGYKAMRSGGGDSWRTR